MTRASPAQAWALLSDVAAYDRLFSSVHRVEVLRRMPGKAGRPEQIEATWVETFAGMAFDTRVALTVAPHRRLVTFRSHDGTPAMSGRIEVKEHEEGAQVVYETWIDAGWMPTFLLRSAARDQGEQMARAVAAHATAQEVPAPPRRAAPQDASGD